MVAYSFKQRFVEPIQLGLQPGPWLPGTAQCFLIGRAACIKISKITIDLQAERIHVDFQSFLRGGKLDGFARWDGFADWAEMAAFWRAEHGDVERFVGILIEWEPVR